LHKYGLPRPDNYPYPDKIYRSLGIDHPAGIIIKIYGEQREETKEEIEERNRKEAAARRKLEFYQQQYETLTRKYEHGEDPFTALSMLLVRSVDNYDTPTAGDVIGLIERISIGFIEKYSQRESKESWSPQDRIIVNYLDHVLDLIRVPQSTANEVGIRIYSFNCFRLRTASVPSFYNESSWTRKG
jgi:hypothetical protein